MFWLVGIHAVDNPCDTSGVARLIGTRVPPVLSSSGPMGHAEGVDSPGTVTSIKESGLVDDRFIISIGGSAQ